MRKNCCRNNSDTNISTVLVVFAVIIFTMLSVFPFKLSPKTNINHEKLLIILSMRKKSANSMFRHFVIGNLFYSLLSYFISASDLKTFV